MKLVHEHLRMRGPVRINETMVERFEMLHAPTDVYVSQAAYRSLMRIHGLPYRRRGKTPFALLTLRAEGKLRLPSVTWQHGRQMTMRMLERNREHQKRVVQRAHMRMILWGVCLSLLSWIRACSL